MELCFKGDISDLQKGIENFSRMFDFRLSSGGETVTVGRSGNGKIEVEKNAGGFFIRYDKKIQFFRALGLLIERMRDGAGFFKVEEEPQFTMNGAMFDVSQGNAVIKTDYVRKILDRMAAMGLNMFMLYTEDSFEIKGEPYFGYMRSKYTFDELKALDDYADMYGIEMIPCVQTLAHLIDALKWQCYAELREDDDTLLVGEPKTYEFVEKIIKAASAPFRTKRIHIGMDEAYKLGQGQYLLKNGYKSKLDIMTEHLNNVIKITNKYGLKPMIWSDMYFSAASKTGNYYDLTSTMPQEIISRTPKEVQLVYWDYFHDDMDTYCKLLEKHKLFGSDPIFAGAVWSWTGFAANYGLTIKNTNAALNACKKEGIKEVFNTIWGDDATENNVFSNLLGLQLYAEHGYARELSEEKLRKRFEFCTGCRYDDFVSIGRVDEVPGCEKGNPHNYNTSKMAMWQDVLLGLFDKNYEGHSLTGHYQKMEKRMGECVRRNGEFGFVFEYLRNVCSVLSLKAEMGLRLTSAYRSGNREELAKIASEDLPELIRRMKELKNCHRDIWMAINKPMGWDVTDARYGVLLSRLDTAEYRINAYLSGKTDSIEELEQERQYFQCEEGLVQCNVYSRIPTASRLTNTTFYLF